MIENHRKQESAPFFIVGCGRSGTSLLRGLLNAHSQIAIPTESLFMIDYLRARDRFSYAELVDLLLKEPEIVEWGLAVDKEDLAGCASIPEALHELSRRYAAKEGARLWGQKTPRFVRYMELLGNAFPEARFVHVIRDPRAVVNSLIRSDVHRSNPYHGSRRWNIDVTAGLKFEADHPDRVLQVRYEELVSGPGETLQNILDFLDLAFEDSLLKVPVGTEDYSTFYDRIHQNLAEGINSRHIDKWKDQLSLTEVALIESMAAELMERLGYDRVGSSIQVPDTFRLRMQIRRAIGLPLQLLKYIRHRRRYLLYTLKRKRKLGYLREFLWMVNY